MNERRLSARWYWNGKKTLGPDDRPTPPTIALDLVLDMDDKPPRDLLQFNLDQVMAQLLHKLDSDYYGPRFMDLVEQGKAEAEDFDDFVDRWHDLPVNHPQRTEQLHEYLGMTWAEYAEVTQHPKRLWRIIQERRERLAGGAS